MRIAANPVAFKSQIIFKTSKKDVTIVNPNKINHAEPEKGENRVTITYDNKETKVLECSYANYLKAQIEANNGNKVIDATHEKPTEVRLFNMSQLTDSED